MRKIRFHVALLVLALTLGLAGTAAADYTWYSYGGHEYALTETLKTWVEAEAEAVSIGGHLVTINDAAENAWVLNNLPIGSVTWIGFHLVGETWVWSSGEPVTFTNWSNQEPLNDYATIYNYAGTWNTWPNFFTHNGIIERSAPVPLPSALLLLASGLAGLAAWRRRRA